MRWPTVRIADFCTTGSGTTPPRGRADYYQGSIPWVKSGELRETVITDTDEHVSDSALAETSLKEVPAGAVLVAMYGATVGRVGILGTKATTNQAVCHLIPETDKADSRYLFHALKHKARELVGRGVGGAQPNINQGVIRETRILLPPLDEQRRIAEILDDADDLCCLRRRSTSRLDDLSQSVFHEMFGSFIADSRRWPQGRIRDLVRDVKYGTSKKAHSEERGIAVLRMGNITYEGRLDLTDLKYVELDDNEIPKYTVESDDLLFNRTNSKELVGKTAVFSLSQKMAIAGYLIRARTNENADPYYISGYLNSTHGKTTLMNMCKNIVGMANINAQEFQDIPIAIPPLELQKRYRRAIEAINEQREIFQRVQARSDTLALSLRQLAFRGEL